MEGILNHWKMVPQWNLTLPCIKHHKQKIYQCYFLTMTSMIGTGSPLMQKPLLRHHSVVITLITTLPATILPLLLVWFLFLGKMAPFLSCNFCFMRASMMEPVKIGFIWWWVAFYHNSSHNHHVNIHLIDDFAAVHFWDVLGRIVISLGCGFLPS